MTFERYMKHTMEHGHANDRGDNFFSCGLLVSDHAVHGFPGAAAAGATNSAARIGG